MFSTSDLYFSCTFNANITPNLNFIRLKLTWLIIFNINLKWESDGESKLALNVQWLYIGYF